MKKDDFTILVVSADGRGVKSINTKMFHMKLLLFVFLAFICITIVSVGFAYTFYKKAEISRLEKIGVVTHLNVIAEHSIENDVTKKVYNDKIKILEDQLQDLHNLLAKKGLAKKISVGGEFIPAGRLSLTYLDFLHEDAVKLNETFRAIPLGIPLEGRVNSGFGYRKDPFNSKVAFHSGVDISAKTGDPVKATADGIVKQAGWRKTLGRSVMLEHPKGYKTIYGHLSKLKVKKGQRVKAGDVIALAGSTGRASGPHLHYEVVNNGKKVNPKKFMNIK